MVRRSTAKPGDTVVVTGTIGDSALGLLKQKDNILQKRWQLTDEQSDELKVRYLLPEPRVELAEAVLQYASAAMDVSDGLAGDLAKLCRASGVAAEVDVSRVPLSEAAQAVLVADPTLIETILTGGDDYEILLTLPPEKLPGFRTAADRADIAVTEIGRIVAGEGARFLRNSQTLTFAKPSYSHF
jgi:thiamine-monophosphate kinase